MSASAPHFRPALSKASTGQTSASDNDGENVQTAIAEDRESNIANRLRERMRPRARSDSYSSTATTLNQYSEQCEASTMRQVRRSSTDASREETEVSRRSTDKKPAMKRQSRSTFSDVGRHSNEWLFGGFSVKDTARGLLRRRDS